MIIYNNYILAGKKDMGVDAAVDVRTRAAFVYTGTGMMPSLLTPFSPDEHTLLNNAGSALLRR
jgi:hypothetical protein